MRRGSSVARCLEPLYASDDEEVAYSNNSNLHPPNPIPGE